MHPIHTYKEPVQRLFLRLLADPDKLVGLLLKDQEVRTNTGAGLLDEDCSGLGWIALETISRDWCAPEDPSVITELAERCGPALLVALDAFEDHPLDRCKAAPRHQDPSSARPPTGGLAGR